MFCHDPLVIMLVNVRHMRRWQGCRPSELEVWMVDGRIEKFYIHLGSGRRDCTFRR